jgi:hypothetical protein
MVKNGDVFKHEWGELGLMQAGSTAKNPLCGRPSIMVVIARATPPLPITMRGHSRETG